MLVYTLRRLLLVIPVMLAVTVLTFAIIQFTPGDPARLALGNDAPTQQVVQLRKELGLDEPLVVQFFRYVARALVGNFGNSIRSEQPVAVLIAERFPSTLELTLAAMLLAVVFGIGLGVLAATTNRKSVDIGVMFVALLGLSIPGFYLAMMLMLLFGVQLRWVSVIGGSGWQDLILPAIALGLGSAAVLARLTRSSVMEVKQEDYVRTARAKGASERAVIWRHTLRNALIPVVTIIGLQFAGLLGGAVFVESIFSRPGLGKLAVDSVAARDYPVIQGLTLFLALVYVVMNLLVDVLYGVLDPRISYE